MGDDSTKSRPSLFISHKHADSKIADALRDFIDTYTGGKVRVFQSSGAWTDAPKVGRNLNKELRQALWKNNVLILLYTNPNHDWNYCMWECGVASHPESPDTKIIVFICGGQTPSLFVEQVNVNARQLVDIQKFTNSFLTDADFFPEFSGPITAHQASGQKVAELAAELHQTLQPLLPPEKEDEVEEWPAWPFLRLEITQNHVERIRAAKPEERLKTTTDIVTEECLLVEGDKVAGQIFGFPTFTSGMRFGEIVNKWREQRPGSNSKWVEVLCGQIMSGAQWNFLKPTWELMQSVDSDNWYAPKVNRVRRLPAQRSMQFDVYFYRLNIDEEKGAVHIPVPDPEQ